MKIGILGWYHQNNAGDDRILYCIKTKFKALGTESIEIFIAWDELSSRIDEINKCTFLIVGGGGLILRNTNRLVSAFEKITIPFGLMGVSVDSEGPDNSDFIAYLSKRSKFILVRDSFSRKAFEKYNKSDLFQAPDLTFLYPYKSDSGINKEHSVAVSLRPWSPNVFKQYTKNHHRFTVVSRKIPFLVTMLGLWKPEKFMRTLSMSVSETMKPFPLHNSPNGDNILLGKFFNSENLSEFDIEILRQSDYLIGMRLHAIIFATQLGIPFIALNYASKVRNYVEDLDLAEFIVEIYNYKNIGKKIKEIKKNHADISMILLSQTKQFQLEVHSCVDTIFKTYIDG